MNVSLSRGRQCGNLLTNSKYLPPALTVFCEVLLRKKRAFVKVEEPKSQPDGTDGHALTAVPGLRAGMESKAGDVKVAIAAAVRTAKEVAVCMTAETVKTRHRNIFPSCSRSITHSSTNRHSTFCSSRNYFLTLSLYCLTHYRNTKPPYFIEAGDEVGAGLTPVKYSSP